MESNKNKKIWGFIYFFFINKKKYIGQTAQTKHSGLKKRLKNHLRCRKYNQYFHNSLRKNFHSKCFHIIEAHYDIIKNLSKILNEREIFWIAELDTYDLKQIKGWNLTKGGGGWLGMKHSEVTKEKLRIKAKNRWSINEERQKQSIKRKKYCQDYPNFQNGKKNPMFGRTGKEHPMFGKQRLDLIERNKKIIYNGEKNGMSRPVVLISPEGEEYRLPCYAPFCKEHNLDVGTICQVLKGKQKHHKNWTGKYLD